MKNSRKCLLIFTSTFTPFHGGNIRQNYLVRELSSRGLLVDVISPDKGPALRGVRYITHKYLRADRRSKVKEIKYFLYPIFAGLGGLKLRQRYDFIYAHEMPACFAAFLINKRQKTKLFFDFYEFDVVRYFPKTSILYKIFSVPASVVEHFSMNSADGIFVLSETMKAMMERDFDIRTRLIVIYDGVDTRLFSNRGPRTAGKEPVLMYHGVVEKRDDLETVVNAIALLDKRGVRCSLRIFGGGRHLSELKDFCLRSGISDRISFHGWVAHEEIPEHIKKADFGIASLGPDLIANMMVVSRKAYEYMACGVPVIVSGTRASREIIRDGVNGITYEAGSPESLADALARYSADDGRLRLMAANARKTVEQELDIRKISSSIADVLMGR